MAFRRFTLLLLALLFACVVVLGDSGQVGAAGRPAAGASSGRWIEVNLAAQQLTAWQDGRIVMNALISSGRSATPTVRGTFHILRKYRRVRMRGPGYNLPNVPYSMFFYRGYAIHGTYWHSNFGHPMSHGCVNLPTAKAAWLYRWAPIGTRVVVH